MFQRNWRDSAAIVPLTHTGSYILSPPILYYLTSESILSSEIFTLTFVCPMDICAPTKWALLHLRMWVSFEQDMCKQLVRFAKWIICCIAKSVIVASSPLVSRGQTLFRTEGKGLGHGHGAVYHPALWSAYQSQHSIFRHMTSEVWFTGRFKISVWVEHELEAWEVRWGRSVLSHELKSNRNRNRGCRKVTGLTLAIAIVTSWLDLCD